MDIKRLNAGIATSPQILPTDIEAIARAGYRSIICNRPDREEQRQPTARDIESASRAAGLGFAHIPVVSGSASESDAAAMAKALASLPGPVLAYCRSGARSAKLAEMAGALRPANHGSRVYDIVIVGGGSAGIATAASIRKRNRDASIAIIEPSEAHYYQPGWTMVGAGVFDRDFTVRRQAELIPRGVEWIKASASGFAPEENKVLLCDGGHVSYRVLIACPGIKLDWAAIPGLIDTLGHNGVTSNYDFDLAPYTNRLVKTLKAGGRCSRSR